MTKDCPEIARDDIVNCLGFFTPTEDIAVIVMVKAIAKRRALKS